MKLSIITDIAGMASQWRKWAVMEKEVDFRKDRENALKCSVAFAVMQFKSHLERCIDDLEVTVSDNAAGERFVKFSVADIEDGGGFHIDKVENGIVLAGHGRNGLFNGIYELLHKQGWRWTEPGKNGENLPENPSLDFLDCESFSFTPSFKYRMIDQYRDSDASIELLDWFSKNHINVVQYKPGTCKYADKLGMLSRKGGHLLHDLMWPDAPFDDGRTVYEAHPEWYGLPADGERTEKTAADVQPCFSNPELLDWLSARICGMLQKEMSDVDILDLWGFDTLGKSCSCPECEKIGNGSDQFLHFLDAVQRHLNAGLNRRVMLNTIAYSPTNTIQGPIHPAPKCLAASDSFVIFYPITRCYRHLLGDKECKINEMYRDSLREWHENAPEMPLWSGEYYNVSLFEDLPLVFGKLVADEMKYYHACGCKGATYMHNFSVSWGVRSLTQMLHTRYAWNVNTDYDSFLQDYFVSRYGKYAGAMKKIYADVQEAFRDITSWRAYSKGKAAVWKFGKWDGKKPTGELVVPYYDTEEKTVAELGRCSALLEGAVEQLRELLAEEMEACCANVPQPDIVAFAQGKTTCWEKLEYRIGEDLRGMIYGRDSMALYAALAEYYNALRLEDRKRSDAAWAKVDGIAKRMSEYFIPILYEQKTPGVHILDALSRTKIKDVVARCRRARATGEA